MATNIRHQRHVRGQSIRLRAVTSSKLNNSEGSPTTLISRVAESVGCDLFGGPKPFYWFVLTVAIRFETLTRCGIVDIDHIE